MFQARVGCINLSGWIGSRIAVIIERGAAFKSDKIVVGFIDTEESNFLNPGNIVGPLCTWKQITEVGSRGDDTDKDIWRKV
jgi:hypothetical protein